MYMLKRTAENGNDVFHSLEDVEKKKTIANEGVSVSHCLFCVFVSVLCFTGRETCPLLALTALCNNPIRMPMNEDAAHALMTHNHTCCMLFCSSGCAGEALRAAAS